MNNEKFNRIEFLKNEIVDKYIIYLKITLILDNILKFTLFYLFVVVELEIFKVGIMFLYYLCIGGFILVSAILILKLVENLIFKKIQSYIVQYLAYYDNKNIPIGDPVIKIFKYLNKPSTSWKL